MKTSIKHWPQQERPRERLIKQGAQALSDAELLAIFLRTGYKQHSAVEVARMLLSHFGSLRQVLEAPADELIGFKGIGTSKYALLMASKELSQRHLSEQITQQEQILSSPALIIDLLKSKLRHEKQELFAILLLNQQCQLIDFDVIYKGTFQSCQVSTQEIVRHALLKHGVYLIAVHNHPQGHALPSPEDLQFTEKLQQACNLMDLALADHFIISCNDYFSFAENGMLSTQ